MEGASRTEVRAVYDRIASHFAETRSGPWPEVLSFLEETSSGTRGLDLGCGNGRHVEALCAQVDTVLAADISRELLQEAQTRVQASSVNWIQAEASQLPIPTSSIRVAIYVATLHHLSSRNSRVQSLNEVARVLEPSGRALISVWSVTDDRFSFETGRDQIVPWTLPSGTEIDRFYHVYDRGEFRAELQASRLAVDEVFESSGNWYAVVQKG